MKKSAVFGCVLALLAGSLSADGLYGDKEKDRHVRLRPGRHLLHAVQLEFPHPVTGRHMTFAARPPADILYARG